MSQYERLQAPVKFYNRERGYGFIKRSDKLDVFFVNKALVQAGIKEVKADDVLEFDLVPVQGKGGKAINLRKIEK